MTISDLLKKPYYRNNKSLLAIELGISRNTLLKYSEDKEGLTHIIRKEFGDYVIFGRLTKVKK
tara:strand:+ start:743 stop:931 length:189 start_codon:yes stop_codon:yes gene_type:complete